MSGISLKEAMKIYPFSTAVLKAGNADAGEAIVESVNIQEVPNVIRWLKGGEILFTSGYAFANAEGGVALIRQLVEKHVAALVLKPGQYFSEIPAEMVDCANELGLPLFELPEELPYMDCIIPIMERLTQKRLYALERTELTKNRLIQSIIDGEGLDGICKVLETTSGCSVMIMTNQGMTLSHCLRTEEDYEYEQVLSRFCRRIFSDSQRSPYAVNTCTKIAVGGNTAVIYPISVGEEILAVMFVTAPAEQLDSAQIMLLDNVGSMVTVELMKEREVMTHEQKVSGQFLESLLSSDSYLDNTNLSRWSNYL